MGSCPVGRANTKYLPRVIWKLLEFAVGEVLAGLCVSAKLQSSKSVGQG